VLTLSAVLAWVLLQVPLVLCSATCKQSVDSALLMAKHACHDTRSARHQHRCLRDRGHDHAQHGTPTKQAPERDGEHVLTQRPSLAQISPVALPAHALTAPLLACSATADVHLLTACRPGTLTLVLDPPRPTAAAPLSDRLLV